MSSLTPTPTWRTLSRNGYYSQSDRDWFYHFREGGYKDIIHVDIVVGDSSTLEAVRSALKEIHVPGEETISGFRVFGYLQNGQNANYI